MTAHRWEFSARFRRRAFGWRSDLPIRRIKEAVAEIKHVARKEPVTAAEGAVTLLERLSPALEQVDSSSGALGTAVNRAIDALVPIIAKADVEPRLRQRWLVRLWQAVEADDVPYIEDLGDYWGELCATPALASAWADAFLPLVERAWSPNASDRGYFKGTTACLAALYSAGRYPQVLTLLDRAPFKWWGDRRWGVKALVAMGKKAEALRYAEDSKGLNVPSFDIARACEAILLSSGLADEAYRRYAIEANQCTTNLATFRAMVKKYPHIAPAEILRDLIASTPGAEGKWFAAAKDAGLFDLATELAMRSPADPRTLLRAAKDYGADHPEFAVASGLAALHWMALGYGYEITGQDVLAAYDAVMRAAPAAGMDGYRIEERIRGLIENPEPASQFVKKILAHRVSG